MPLSIIRDIQIAVLLIEPSNIYWTPLVFPLCHSSVFFFAPSSGRRRIIVLDASVDHPGSGSSCGGTLLVNAGLRFASRETICVFIWIHLVTSTCNQLSDWPLEGAQLELDAANDSSCQRSTLTLILAVAPNVRQLNRGGSWTTMSMTIMRYWRCKAKLTHQRAHKLNKTIGEYYWSYLCLLEATNLL